MTTRAKPKLTTTEALALANEAAGHAVEALVLTREEVAKIPEPVPPDPRDDPNQARLIKVASTMSRRFNPLRNRWPELREIDARITELDLKKHGLFQRIEELGQRRILAPQRDEARLADWFAAGSKGDRPPLEVTQLEEEIASTQADLAALEQLTERAYAEKVAFVTRHRRRLVKDAARETESARDRYLTLVGELEQARDELVATRQTEVWASIYPSDTLVSQPPTLALCGGLLRPVEEAIPGLKHQLPAHAVLKLLRSDATHLSTVSTVDQAAEIQSTTAGVLTGRGALWAGSEEDLERQQREKERARAEYESVWGPPERVS